MNKPLTRRDMVKILAGLGLVGCDARKPKEGVLGTMENVNRNVESFLLSKYEPSPDAITPAMAFPSYHVAPQVPAMPADWRLIVSGAVTQRLALTYEDLRAVKTPDGTDTHVPVPHHEIVELMRSLGGEFA